MTDDEILDQIGEFPHAPEALTLALDHAHLDTSDVAWRTITGGQAPQPDGALEFFTCRDGTRVSFLANESSVWMAFADGRRITHTLDVPEGDPKALAIDDEVLAWALRGKGVQIFDHCSGTVRCLLPVEGRVGDVVISNRWVLVHRDYQVIEVWDPRTGEKAWEVPTILQLRHQASGDGRWLFVGTHVFDRGGRRGETSSAVEVVGNELWSLTAKGTLWHGGVDDWPHVPDGGELGDWAWRLGIDRTWAVRQGRVLPRGAEGERLATASPDPGWGHDLELQSPTDALVGRFVTSQPNWFLEVDGDSPRATAIAGWIQEGPKLVETFPIRAGVPLHREGVRGPQMVVCGQHRTRVDGVPGRNVVLLHPDLELTPSLFERRTLRVVDERGAPIAGAQVRARHVVQLTAADGTARVSASVFADAIAVHEGRVSALTTDDTIVVPSHGPVATVRVVDASGAVLAGPGRVDDLHRLEPALACARCGTVHAEGHDAFTIRLWPTVRIRLPFYATIRSLSSAVLTDAAGVAHDLTARHHRQVALGPASVRLEVADAAWGTGGDVGPGVTEFGPVFRRLTD